MKVTVLYHLFTFLCLLCGSSFSLDSTTAIGMTEEIAAPKGVVLIARRESSYKSIVAKKVKKLLAKQNVRVEIVDIKLLKKKDTQNYDAVVILNRIRAWHLNFHSRRFFRKVDQSERKKVVMVTTAFGSWKSKEKDIDAVTIASEETNVKAVVRTIYKKVIILLALD